MTSVTSVEHTLFRRSLLVLILVTAFVAVVLSITTFLLFTHLNNYNGAKKTDRLNILVIVIDDLRPALGCYGDRKAITPNIDQLAAISVLFSNAYTQQALSAPSRISFLTGQRPDKLCLLDNNGRYWRDRSTHCQNDQSFLTLPQHFKNHGYETISIGKVFHHGKTSNHTDDYPYSWSSEPYHPSSLKNTEVCPTKDGERRNLLCPISSNEQNLPDIQVADYAVNYLLNRSENVNTSGPFFLAVGFYKPHIPFKVPSEYFDLHPLEDMDLAQNNTKPEGLPDTSWNPWMDIRSRDDVKDLGIDYPFGSIPDDFQKQIKQGYYASVSYIDDQVGKILEALEVSGYASNTAIFFLSDHGFSLGEHGEWSKYSNFEVSLKVPLLAFVPELIELKSDRKKFRHISVTETDRKEYVFSTSTNAKFVADEFVELVDLFPTIAETANIAMPLVCPSIPKSSAFCSEGTSFFPVLLNYASPSMDFSWKTEVFSQYPRPSVMPRNDSDEPALKHIKIMGYTIRDKYFRYTRWVKFNSWDMKPHLGTFEGHELYDESTDPLENNNLVDIPNYSNIVIGLFKKLRNGWRHSLPYGVHSL